jgi:transposase-like protein
VAAVDANAVRHQHDKVLDQSETTLPEVHAHLDEHRADMLAFLRSPRSHGARFGSTTPANASTARLAAYRRLRVFPDRTSIIRLAGAVLADQNDECADGRRYLGLDVLARS